ncbi:MAG: hypothetical protein LBU32_06050 [Clostridiales bacterium]|nr:hypothetical protein [Clostridiales bacterium]
MPSQKSARFSARQHIFKGVLRSISLSDAKIKALHLDLNAEVKERAMRNQPPEIIRVRSQMANQHI